MTGAWLPLAGATSGASSSSISDLHTVEITDDALHWTPGPTGNPQGVWDEATGRTWIAFLKDGGDLYATYYDHATGDIATPVLVAAFPFNGADFHHVPVAMFDANGRMHIVYGGHDTDAHRHYRMNNARDLTAWTAQTLDVGTYPFACTDDDGTLIFTDRPEATSHSDTWPSHQFGAMHRSTNGGTSWTRTEIVDTSGAPETISDFYEIDLLFAAGRMHMLWTVARGSIHGDLRYNLYYASMDPDTLVWESADGTGLGTSINWTDHTECLVKSHTEIDHNPRGSLAWHHGAPAVASWLDDGDGDAELTTHLWDGSAWVESDVIETRTATITPCLVSTPDELVLLSMDSDDEIHQWRLIDGRWEASGLVLRVDGVTSYGHVTHVRGGPGLALTVAFDRSGGFPGNDDTVVGPLTLITRRHDADGVDHDHTHDLNSDSVRDAGRWEVVVSGTPAEAVTTEDETDWLYTWTTE